ncbi:MAG TPA: adenylate/guanylate cyclase domain-containing protein [Actinomycetota bacterium]|nr:adenylate/guanylate cyclase domain-containing protein [Actinomycetota bacterium]
MIGPLAVVWVVAYWLLGRPLSAAIPFGYQVASVASLVIFIRTKRYRLFRFAQVLLMLLLPFLLQLSLGGFVPSSGVIIWAVWAPFGALMFYGAREAVPWLMAFIGLTAVAGILDPLLPEGPPIPMSVVVTFFVLNFAAVAASTYLLVQYFVREREKAMAALRIEREKSERLLLNVLPEPIAGRLKEGEGIIADGFPEVTVLFADIVDFTPLSDRLAPDEVVALLDEVFTAFDRLADDRGLEKIKTIGDAYMVAGGIPVPRPDHAEAVAEMALGMLEEVARCSAERGMGLAVRIGIDTGPVVAGVIGRRKFIYDLWGDTVNTASRMESHGLAGAIQVTPATYERLHDRYEFEQRGPVAVKSKGKMTTYMLVGRKLSRVSGRRTAG